MEGEEERGEEKDLDVKMKDGYKAFGWMLMAGAIKVIREHQWWSVMEMGCGCGDRII